MTFPGHGNAIITWPYNDLDIIYTAGAIKYSYIIIKTHKVLIYFTPKN
jgi:hypothetical protein